VRLDPGPVTDAELLAGGPAVGAALKAVKEQLRAVPDNGIGYGMLRFLNHDTRDALRELLDPQISFNYLGRHAAAAPAAAWSAVTWDGVVGGADLAGSRPDPATPLTHALSVNAVTEDTPDGPSLTVVWSWPRTLLVEPRVRELMAAFTGALRGLVAHATGDAAGGLTPSDTGLVALTQDQLDRFESAMGAGATDETDETDTDEFDDWAAEADDEWEMAR
jgi:non-ribosomal peptide synthase protein (TIGR01720 family)